MNSSALSFCSTAAEAEPEAIFEEDIKAAPQTSSLPLKLANPTFCRTRISKKQALLFDTRKCNQDEKVLPSFIDQTWDDKNTAVSSLTIKSALFFNPILLKPLFTNNLTTLDIAEYSGDAFSSPESLVLFSELQNLAILKFRRHGPSFQLAKLLNAIPNPARLDQLHASCLKLEHLPLLSRFSRVTHLCLHSMDVSVARDRLGALSFDAFVLLDHLKFVGLWCAASDDLDDFLEHFVREWTVCGVLRRLEVEVWDQSGMIRLGNTEDEEELSVGASDLKKKGILVEECVVVGIGCTVR